MLFDRYSLLALVFWAVTTWGHADDESFQREFATAVRAAANHVLPSVVSVEVIGTSGQRQGDVEQDAPTSGVIVDAEGFLLVSSLVTQRPSATILVILPDGSRSAATVIAEDHHRDLVLLKIQTKSPLIPIHFPLDSMAIKSRPIGSTLISIGRYGADQSPMISTGILSAIDRLDGIALQTDARVPPAMYGGPVVDLYGNVLGILIPAVAEGGAETSTSWYDSGIAFAIPTDVIARKIERLKQGKEIKKGLVGIVAGSRDLNSLDTTIAAVRTRSPADQAGILAGDQVISVEGVKVRRHQEIRQVLGSYDAGETVRIRLQRTTESGNKEIDVEVLLADSIPPLQPQRLGVIVSQYDPEDQDRPTITVDAIVPSSAASGKLETGDQIVRIGKTEIESVLTLRRQLVSMEPERTLDVGILRDGDPLSIKVEPRSIAGAYESAVPEIWLSEHDGQSASWKATELKLPNAANEAAFTMPSLIAEKSAGKSAEKTDKDASKKRGPQKDTETDPVLADAEPDQATMTPRRLGLLMLLLEPGESTPLETAEAWLETAAEEGVVVCAVASEDPARWQPKELATIAELVKAIEKRATIDSVSVAVGSLGAIAGQKATAADSMAMAVAISQSDVFFGVAVSNESRTPAIRLRANEPATSLQVLMPAENEEDFPTWAPALELAGYPVSWDGKIDQASLLRWVRLLQAI